MRRAFIPAVLLSAFAPAALAAGFPDYLVVRERLGTWPRDTGGGRVVARPLLARIVDESGATLFEELHCDVVAVGGDAEVELALGTVDPAANPLDLRFDGRWSVRVLACADAACADGIPVDASRCDGETLIDKPLAVAAYAWRAKYTEHADTADHALTADDCDRLDGFDSSDFMPAGADEWVNEVGDTMTGPLVLSGDPTQDAHAATKKYVDDQFRGAVPRGYAILGTSLASPPGFAPSGEYIATDGEWETLTPLPTPSAATATVVDGLILARTEPNVIHVYDPATTYWSAMIGPGTGQAIVNMDGALHLLSLDAVGVLPREHWERPAGGSSWQPRALTPDHRVDDVVASGGRLYALTESAIGDMSFWVWEAATDSWRLLAPPPRQNFRRLVSFDGKIWSLGGTDTHTGPFNARRVDLYDPALGWWAPGSPLKRARQRPAAAVLDGRLYVFGGDYREHGLGGWNDAGGYSVEMFDPAVGAWQVLPTSLPTNTELRAAAPLNGRIHLLGGGVGYRLNPDEGNDAHEAFTPQRRWYVHVKQ